MSTLRRKLIAMAAIMGLVVGSFGFGIAAAQLLTTQHATQTVTLSAMGITLTTDTPGATISSEGALSCPTVNIPTPTGIDPVGCDFSITSSGNVPASAFAVTVSASISPSGKIWSHVAVNGGAATDVPLVVSPGTDIPVPQTLPVSVHTAIQWDGVTPAVNFGWTTLVTYQIVAS